MGQKINPISLRLASSTKLFDNIWYNDYSYSKLISFDFFLTKYINTFLKFFKLPSARISLCYLRNTLKIYTFFCYPGQSREINSRIFQIPNSLISLKNSQHYKTSENQLSKSKQSLTDSILWNQIYSTSRKKVLPNLYKNIQLTELETRFPIENITQANITKITSSKSRLEFFQAHDTLWKSLLILESLQRNSKIKIPLHSCYDSNSTKQLFFNVFTDLVKNNQFNRFVLKNSTAKLNKNSQFKLSLIELLNYYIVKQYNNKESVFLNQKTFNLQNDVHLFKYKNYLEDFLSTHSALKVQLFPFKITEEWQSANYFADELVFLLERRVPFRRLKSILLKQISQNQKIRGIRITCSGRVGGKSKKAQRAKVESIKYGQTSLHVFSSKIDFAARTAYTALGSTGIKVWICYN